MQEQQILKIVLESLREIGQEDNRKELLKPDRSTSLYGQDGVLDSMGLVRLISSVEEKINEILSKEIVIASEKAMSRSNSPFKNVGTLVSFIVELLNE